MVLPSGATVCSKRVQVRVISGFSDTGQHLGPGRGGPDRPQRTLVTVRYPITAVSQPAAAIAAQQETLGWRAYVTNAPATQLTLADAVLTYRDEWLIERGFHRLKGAPFIARPAVRQAR